MTEILGIYGLQGWGKTALTTGFGYLAYKNGYDIYSNYPLSFDYKPVETIKQAQEVRNGYLLFDEFWKWVHARTSQSNVNKVMMGICLLNRKRNVSIIYNSQLPRTIDVILKDVTNFRYLPHLETHKDGRRYVHYIMRDLLGRETPEMFFNMPIDELGKLFNTRYEVGDINKTVDNKSFLELGKELEKKCLIALKKVKGVKATSIKNSGIGTDFKGDILATFKKQSYLIDVKSANKNTVVICNPENTCSNEMNKFIRNAKTWNMKPLIIFPRNDKEGNYLNYPNNWYVYSVKNNSYLLLLRNNMVRYNKIINESNILKNGL